MTVRVNLTFVVFGLLGSFLLINLALPIASLLFHADWAGWVAALRQPEALQALMISIEASAISLTIMTALGIPLGYLLARGDLPFKRLWIILVFLPMVVPDLAAGILLLRTFGPQGIVGQAFDAGDISLTNNLAGIVLAQLFVAAPFAIISTVAAFTSVDRKLEMAAAMLGDSQWHIFRRISLPLAWPGIAAGLTLAWIRAMGEFGSTLIVAYSPHSVPVYMWIKFESEGIQGALPAAFCLVVLAGGAVLISMLLTRLTGFADLTGPLGKVGILEGY
ncbi:MAG: ABC transporter permease [Blastocatellia bacterium]|nr:ABC transporter permease [Blastocatellia bacterium]